MKQLLALATLLAACGSPKPAVIEVPKPDPIVNTPEPVARPTTPPVPVKPEPSAAESFLAECDATLAQAADQQTALYAVTGPRTVENTLETYNELQRFVNNAAEKAGLWSEVHPDGKVRDAARTCEQKVSKFVSDLFLDKRAYDAVRAVPLDKADADTKRFALFTLRDYKRSGIDLSDAKRARAKAIDEEITKTAQLFSQAIAEDTRYIEVKDPARLAGLPADWIAAHKPDANGTIKISTDYPDYIPFATYADDDELRKQLYVAFRLRGSAHNEEYLQTVLKLRMEKAKLLGFRDWADYESDDKMLRTGKRAAEFIAQVAGPTKARAKRDYDELLKELKTIDPKAKVVNDWQKGWLENKVKHKKYAVDSQEVRKYFSFDKSLAGLLAITGQIYDIQYRAVSEARPWDASVQVFDVVRGAEKLGRIYLDLHPREGKYKHAAQFPILDGVPGKQLPEGALICNFDTGLMDHGDVVTMFHEFGHLMHHVLGGKHHWVRQSGVATEADFVEAPSQMFEEWGWRYETLSKFATNAKGETIPKELVEKMRQAYKFGRGTGTAQQMLYAALSLQLHQLDPAKLDGAGQDALVKKLQAQYTPFAFVEGTKFQTSFGHLMGYSSRYYTYMWSLAIAKDMLTAFDKGGLLDTATTTKYRDAVLAGGGTKDAADLVKDFLGRPYNFKAFEKFMAE